MNTKKPNAQAVLAKAVLKAGKSLGLSEKVVAEIIGKDLTTISHGIDPKSKAGELSLLLVRCYRSLYALMGGDVENMQHFMRTPNKATNNIPPNEQIKTTTGLVELNAYLGAIRDHAYPIILKDREFEHFVRVCEEGKAPNKALLDAVEEERYARVLSASMELFEQDAPNALRWLKMPVRALGYKRPVDMLSNEADTQMVLDVIIRLEHGAFT